MNNVKVTSSLFYDAFTGSGGGGVPYYPGNYLDRISHALYFEIAWNFLDTRFTFDASDSSITASSRLDARNFRDQGFKAGDLIDIVGTTDNDVGCTIISISDNGKTIVTDGTFTDEIAEQASVHGTTPITALDFYFNLVKNDSEEDYFSLTDSQTKQKFTVSGVDPENSTPINFVIATKSFGWIVNSLTSVDAGTTSEVTIRGEGIDDYKQKFRITQLIKFTAPVYLVGQFNNFSDDIPPEYFYAQSSLKYICKLDAKYSGNSPAVAHTGGITDINGYNAWSDEGKAGSRPEYKITSISYLNADDFSHMDRLDVAKDVRVTMTIVSRNFLFADGGVIAGTKMDIVFQTCPSIESDYQNTETTLIENFFIDNCFSSLGATISNGTNFGTSRQVITNASFVYENPGEATISFVFSAGSELLSYWQGKADGDRYYSIALITQDITITTTEDSDRVTCRTPFESADWDREDSSISSLTRTGGEAFKFPDQLNFPQGNIIGMEGEKWIATLPFRINKEADSDGNTPTLKDFTFQILAQKTGVSDFVLEQKIISTAGYRKLLGVQEVDYEDTRGFIGPNDDPYNMVFIVRDTDNDNADEAAYLAHYGLVLRYEDWINALTQFQVLNGGVVSPIEKYIENVNQQWSNYNNVEGWSLNFKFSWTVTAADGVDTPFWTYMPITVYESETANWPSGTGELTMTRDYFIWDEVSEVEGDPISLIRDDGNMITLVRATYTGDYALDATASGWHGMVFANFAGGSIYDRRVASTDRDAETTSPFTATPENLLATYSFASANARINIFMDGALVEKIEVETLFNSSLYDGLVENVDVFTSLGLLYTSISS